MISITIKTNAAEVLRHLREFPAAMAQGIARALDRRNELTVGQIQARKLSQRGPTTLGVVTNRLRSSIRPSLAQVAGPSRIVSAIGSNVKYAGAHEYGFDGTVQIPAHSRRVTQAFGRPLREPVTAQVRAHAAKRHIPARAFISSTVGEESGKYSADISAAILRAWEGNPAT